MDKDINTPAAPQGNGERRGGGGGRAMAFGHLAMLAMQHPSYRNLAIADLDWLIGPAAVTGNFIIANTKRDDGNIVPIGAVVWARVSQEVDARLMEHPERPFRLSPQEYTGGDICWIAHTFGPPQVVDRLLKALVHEGGLDENGKEIPPGPLAGKEIKQRMRDESGRIVVAAAKKNLQVNARNLSE